MSYSLNNIPLSDYGIKASQAPGSNVALTGHFDLPKRLHKPYQIWDDGGEIEAFVDADDIMIAGRELRFYGLIKESRNITAIYLDQLQKDIEAFTDLVVFHSDVYGDFNVKVKKIDPIYYNGVTSIIITMREPQPDLTGGVLPATGDDKYTADSIPLKSFGMYVRKVSGRGHTAAKTKEYSTIWDKEGYHINGLTPNEVRVEGFVKADTLLGFQSHIKALWKLLTDPGLRLLHLNNYVTIHGFMVGGFQVTGFLKTENTVIANVDLKFINVKEVLTVFTHDDVNGKVMATEDGKLFIL